LARTAHENRPEELLDAIALYLVSHGVARASLRPLGKAVGASPRVLLYYFGSKQKMVTRALGRVRERQRVAYENMKATGGASPREACQAIWKSMSAAETEPLFRLFFETYALALREPKRFREFRESAIEDWLEFLGEPLRRKGRAAGEVRAYATIVLAGFRGFMLDYCATRDRKRLNRAVEMWLDALEAVRVGEGGEDAVP
jgi:AcrR family transcriptional regulator